MASPWQRSSGFPKSQIAIGWARKSNWLKFDNNVVTLTDDGKKVEKTAVENALEEIDKKGETNAEALKILMSRNLVEEAKAAVVEAKPVEKVSFWKKILSMFHRKKEVKVEGKAVATSEGEISQLTPEEIKTGEWKSKPFRKYDVNAPAPAEYPGKKQPYVRFIEDIREKLVGLGFQEMKGPLCRDLLLELRRAVHASGPRGTRDT